MFQTLKNCVNNISSWYFKFRLELTFAICHNFFIKLSKLFVQFFVTIIYLSHISPLSRCHTPVTPLEHPCYTLVTHPSHLCFTTYHTHVKLWQTLLPLPSIPSHSSVPPHHTYVTFSSHSHHNTVARPSHPHSTLFAPGNSPVNLSHNRHTPSNSFHIQPHLNITL